MGKAMKGEGKRVNFESGRFSRQVLFEYIGAKGQERLEKSRVLIVGCGALGSVQAELLARAGVGFIRLVDRDIVEESNLQRQSLYSERDIREGLPKAEAARRRLKEIYSGLEVESVVGDFSPGNAEELSSDVDLILDGTDNFETRFLINDLSIKRSIPWIYGAALGSYGLSFNIIPSMGTACLRCIFPSGGSEGETCDTVGVIGPIVNIIGSLQAVEALKFLVGDGENLRKTLLHVNLWPFHLAEAEIGGPSENCETCRKRNFEYLEGDKYSTFEILCGRNTVQFCPPERTELNLEKLAEQLKPSGEVFLNRFLLKFRPFGEREELVFFKDGRIFVSGTDDPTKARTFLARYYGL